MEIGSCLSGNWKPITKVKELSFGIITVPPTPVLVVPTRVIPREEEIPCPFCSELVKPQAKKCRHCGEILDIALRAATRPVASAPTQAIVTNITNVSSTNSTSSALPALVSFFVPGLGQLIQGRVLAAVGWFCLTALAAASIGVGIGLVLLPLMWLLNIVDAAKYRGR